MRLLVDYVQLERIFEGAATEVYRGQRRLDLAPVVVKLLKSEYPSPREIARLRHEYAITRSLDGEGVVKAYALERHGHGLAIVFEDLGDNTLQRLLSSQRLELRTSLRIAASLAATLSSIHRRHVIHKDIKPHNILVDPETARTTLIDFGISTHLSRETQQAVSPDALEGTLAYMSPEQTGRMNRVVDHRTDLYSLGVTLYEMLVGALPFASTSPTELMHSHIARAPEPPHARAPSVPVPVSDIVMKLLAKAAEDRYQSAEGLKADLEACLAALAALGRIEPFPLAQRDRSGELSLPQKLYGRDAEVEALLSAHDRIRRGTAELLLVKGYSGVGKSALVHEIHKALARQGGYFVAGKFDQLSNIPYAPVAQAFGELIRQILTEPEEALARWKERIERAVGGSGQLLIDLIPALGLVLGPQPSVPALGPTESQNRFNLLFQDFLCAFTTAEHPLVLFLDDLQWSDPASLRLLHALLTDPTSAYLLVIGAYRDNEVGPAHPLELELGELRKLGTTLGEITLSPLARADVTRFVEDALGPCPDDISPLVQILFDKTRGNPFFLSQFLHAIHVDKRLVFDPEASAFRWDLEAIRALPSTENVVELVTSQIQKLPEDTRRALMLAACIGHQFDLRTLSTISESHPIETAKHLWDALQGGFLVPLTAEYRFLHDAAGEGEELVSVEDFKVFYRFLHDRVQQAAYALIPSGQEQEIHLRIGRLMWAKGDGEASDEAMLAVARHLNLGAPRLTDPAERVMLARLNLAAGERAKAATAYQAAVDYLSTGMSLLPATRWDDAYALTYALHLERAECESLLGRFEEAEALFEELLSRARVASERGQIHDLRITLYNRLSQFERAVKIGYAALAEIGIELPAPEALGAALHAEFAEVERNLSGRPVAALLDAPVMADVDKELALRLLLNVANPALIHDFILYALLNVKGVNLSLQHGNSSLSADAYVTYGSLLASFMGQFKRAEAFGRVGLALNERFNNTYLVCKLSHRFALYSFSFLPLRTAREHLKRAVQAGLEVGDFAYASYACVHLFNTMFTMGEEIASVLDEVNKRIPLMDRTHDLMSASYLAFARAVLLNLLGRTEGRFSLTSDGFDEAAFAKKLEDPAYSFTAPYYDAHKAQILFLFGDHEGARAAAARGAARLGPVVGMYLACELSFYTCLVLAALYPAAAASPSEQAGSLATFTRHAEKIAALVETCPENFRHKHLLIAAERARITGDELQAMKLYDEAIAAARESGFAQDEALSNELAARFHLAQGRSRFARLYMTDAHYGYLQWGATEKAQELVEKHAALIAQAAAGLPPASSIAIAQSTFTSTVTMDLFDLSTVFRATEAISGETALEKVLERVMRILVENAGAQRGLLLLDQEGELMIEASITVAPNVVKVGPAVPARKSDELPLSLVLYVQRTHEPVVLEDAGGDKSRFAADPYIERARPRSVLCVPMLHQGRLTGVLYLENNAVRKAFTAERFELSGLLATQVAIAVENMRLYARVEAVSEGLRSSNDALEGEVARRTEELREANARLTLELTERARAEAERARVEEERGALQAAMIRAQSERLEELAAPLIPITDRIMVMPLIGLMDARRAEQALETALRGAQARQARHVIVDITGVKEVDAAVASTLMSMASALRLIGTELVLTGISPQVAQTVVGLGIDFGSVVTRGNLQSAMAYALGRSAARAQRAGPKA